MTSEPPAQTIQGVTAELQRLKDEQDKTMELAVYFGMTKGEAKQYEERQRRIYELYTTLFALKDSATHK